MLKTDPVSLLQQVAPVVADVTDTTLLVWFRRDLRLFDHAALHHALLMGIKTGQRVCCAFIFDRPILTSLPRQDRRVSFIWHSLQELKAELKQHGSDLIVRHAVASEAIPLLAQQLNATAVYANHDIEPVAIRRDADVARQLAEQGREFHTYKDQVIFEKNDILTQNGGMYQVFTPYKRAWLDRLTESCMQSWPVTPYLSQLAPLAPQAMPSQADLGFDAMDISVLQPGMSGGEKLFDDFCRRMGKYHVNRDFPAIKGVSYLSVHLRFGTVSIRELVRTAWQMAQSGPLAGDDSEQGGKGGAATWLSELIWREFYQQLLWHRPDLVEHSFKPEYDALAFENRSDYFLAWCEGRTGYPIVDAAMRQLNQTGFMHNRLRMVTASFLVKDLLIDWRWGERYFADRLNDFDLSANNGGWQWSASTGCDAQPYFRIFNPVSQSQRFDPEGKFIRRYCPELATLDNKSIHAPWSVKTGKVRLDSDYPPPIVDHSVQRLAALALFKQR